MENDKTHDPHQPVPAHAPAAPATELTPAQKAEAEEAKRTPLQRFEDLVQESVRRFHDGSGFTAAFVMGMRAHLAELRGDGKHEIVDTAAYDGRNWTVTRPGLHAVQVVGTPGMTVEQAIAAAQVQLNAVDKSTGKPVLALVDTATLDGKEWTVTRAGLPPVKVPSEPGMSAEGAIAAAQPKLDEEQKAADAAAQKEIEANRAAAAKAA